jgi:hypothetical protein
LKPCLKALVLKTSRFRETQNFFETELGMKIEESSSFHFVIHTKGIRILFVASDSDLEVELYLTQWSIEILTIQADPNRIKIISSPTKTKY